MTTDDEGHKDGPQTDDDDQGDATDTEGSASENDNETESDMPDCEVLGQLFSQKSKNKRSSGTRTMRYQR